MKKRILVVSPHPDDAELGIGGSIIKFKHQGHMVFIVDITTGEPTPFGAEEKRKKETAQASKILGIDKRLNLGLENRYLFDTKETRLLLAETFRTLKPDIIFTPYPEDAHPDHVAVTKITEGARFYAKYTKVKLKGRPFYPPYLFYYFCTHLRILPPITFLIDISPYFKQKIKVIRCYKSQFIDNPKNKFVFKYIESINKYLGNLIRVEYAEPVFSKEIIKIEDIATST